MQPTLSPAIVEIVAPTGLCSTCPGCGTEQATIRTGKPLVARVTPDGLATFSLPCCRCHRPVVFTAPRAIRP